MKNLTFILLKFFHARGLGAYKGGFSIFELKNTLKLQADQFYT